MKTLCVFVAVVALALAAPQYGGHGGQGGGEGGHGVSIHHNLGGGGGHGGGGGKGAISYQNEHRHDGKDEEVHIKAHPEYHYGFKVADDHHHDYKTKHEERDGYKVKGSYSLVEPDGKTVRVVDYTSDKKQGFIAKVTYKHHI